IMPRLSVAGDPLMTFGLESSPNRVVRDDRLLKRSRNRRQSGFCRNQNCHAGWGRG
ncbi:hypothetical protein Bpfe_027195, partial [Biomphalaria pfeifferi]